MNPKAIAALIVVIGVFIAFSLASTGTSGIKKLRSFPKLPFESAHFYG
jgi:hypothetical protein